jgi:thiosulfate/3-mercaptopyruvate sulfurtransferase
MSDIPKLIEPEELLTLLDEPNLLIVDLSNDVLYSKMHIPGAVHISPQELMSGSVPYPHKLAPPEKLAAMASAIGLTDDKHVVVYDDEGGGWAGRFIWTLDIIGHKQWSYLNGGLIAWHNEGHPTTDKVPESKPIECDVTVDRSAIIDVQEIMEYLDRGDVENGNLKIWDARSNDEFIGKRGIAERNGHIPGAINCEWTNMMDFTRNQRIHENALEKLAELGLTPDKPTITHCQSHHRSGFTYMLARLLDFDSIRAYEGSWGEWGNLTDTPIEN